jgi:hypothetical protein
MTDAKCGVNSTLASKYCYSNDVRAATSHLLCCSLQALLCSVG